MIRCGRTWLRESLGTWIGCLTIPFARGIAWTWTPRPTRLFQLCSMAFVYYLIYTRKTYTRYQIVQMFVKLLLRVVTGVTGNYGPYYLSHEQNLDAVFLKHMFFFSYTTSATGTRLPARCVHKRSAG